MLLQKFGPIFNGAGGRNFSGQEYPFHRWLRPLGLRYKGSTFIAKTVTINENTGNMPLQADGETPQEMVPHCIYADLWRGLALNAVSLSNKGLDFYVSRKVWHSLKDPSVISFMAIGDTRVERLAEDMQFVLRMEDEISRFQIPIALQRNYSCPNTGHDTLAIVSEVCESLSILKNLNIPIIVKLNALVPPQDARAITEHPACDALCVSNTIPFGELPDQINWKKLFPRGSPLLRRGFQQPGGLSGWPLLPIVCDWITHALAVGIQKPIIASGGLMSKMAVQQVIRCGALGVEISSASFLRPWRVQGMINEGNRLLAHRLS